MLIEIYSQQRTTERTQQSAHTIESTTERAQQRAKTIESTTGRTKKSITKNRTECNRENPTECTIRENSTEEKKSKILTKFNGSKICLGLVDLIPFGSLL